MRTINASSSAMQPASEQDDIVNSPNYEDIAVVELQLCISLTVTECDIDSVTGEIVRKRQHSVSKRTQKGCKC